MCGVCNLYVQYMHECVCVCACACARVCVCTQVCVGVSMHVCILVLCAPACLIVVQGMKPFQVWNE